MSFVHYPAWWNLRRGSAYALQERKIRTTRDLIRAANGQVHDDGEVVFVAVSTLHDYCNAKLKGLTLHLRTAYLEEGVRVLGRNPNTVVYHDPGERPVSKHEEIAPEEIVPKEIALEEIVPKENVKLAHAAQADDATNEKQAVVLPEECFCPITLEPFDDPVVLEDGFTYERAALADWLLTHRTSPMTAEVLVCFHTFPNHAMRQMIRRFQGLA